MPPKEIQCKCCSTYTSWRDGACPTKQGLMGKHQVWSGAWRGTRKTWPRAFIVFCTGNSLGLADLHNVYWLWVVVVSSCRVPGLGWLRQRNLALLECKRQLEEVVAVWALNWLFCKCKAHSWGRGGGGEALCYLSELTSPGEGVPPQSERQQML